MKSLRLASLTLLLFAACATPRAVLKDINRLTIQGDFAGASALVKSSKLRHYGKKNALLYYLDLGLLLHLDRKYSESNQAFEQAKQIANDLFTKSVTREATTFLISDNIRAYHGEDFERALIHVFAALNYHALGDEGAALVEARQVDFYLTKLKTDHGHKNRYTEDAFVRFLMGFFYENNRQTNDAYISYTHSLKGYTRFSKHYKVRTPGALVTDTLRTAWLMGFDDEVRTLKKNWRVKLPNPPPKNSGEIVVLHYNGLAPRKIDTFIEIAFGKGWGFVDASSPEGEEAEKVEKAASIARTILSDEMVKVAFPKYVETPYTIKRMEAKAAAAHKVHKAEKVTDIGAIAIQNLKDRIGRTRAKAIARAVVKFALSRNIAAKVEEKQGAGAAWLTKKLLQVASNATELADKRSWQTLPDEIWMARLVMPKGVHDVNLTFRNGNGRIVNQRDITSVQVKPGKKSIVVVRTAQ